MSHPNGKDLAGQCFGNWTVKKKHSSDKHRRIHWLCVCVCGTERAVNGADLRNGRSKSCGCFFLGPAHHNWNGGKGKIGQYGDEECLLK